MLKDMLVYLRRRADLNKKEVSEKLGISYHTYINYEKGKTKPDALMILKIATMYDVTTDYLLERETLPDTNGIFEARDIPLNQTNDPKNVISAYKSYYSDRDRKELTIVDYEVIDQSWLQNGQEYVVIKQSNNDMSPDILKGDNVIVKLQEKFDDKDLVLIQIEDSPAIVRKIVRKNKDTLFLFAQNSSIRERQITVINKEINYKVIGVVVEIRKRLGKI